MLYALHELQRSFLTPMSSFAAEASRVAPPGGGDTSLAEAAFAGETATVKLAGPAEKVVAGGGGRYLLFHLKKLRQLAVLDVNAAKVVKASLVARG